MDSIAVACSYCKEKFEVECFFGLSFQEQEKKLLNDGWGVDLVKERGENEIHWCCPKCNKELGW